MLPIPKRCLTSNHIRVGCDSIRNWNTQGHLISNGRVVMKSERNISKCLSAVCISCQLQESYGKPEYERSFQGACCKIIVFVFVILSWCFLCE